MASVPFKVKAVYEYSSPHDDDLNFAVGQIITVTAIEDDDWYYGEYDSQDGDKAEGIFPRNFVEKYEPVAPPRPSRNRPKKEPETPVAPPELEPPVLPEPHMASARPDVSEMEPEPDLEPAQHAPPPPEPLPISSPVKSPAVASPSPPPAPSATKPPPPEPMETPKDPEPPVPVPAVSKAAAPPPQKAGPPPVAGKPSSSAFKDRIAAFNKASAPPIAPFKPSGLGSGSGGPSNFIKKPFVAPPPSRNAYVPQAQNAPAPAKVYRREEDPEIREQEAEAQENAERAGLVRSTSNEGVEEEGDQPKPMSLKERIAFLQKQQMEQAQRHAEAAAKKEKPKRPAKKRIESHDSAAPDADASAPSLERRDTEDTTGRASLEEPPHRAPPTRRKSSRGAVERIQDGNEADMSGAGDTTEGPDELTEREESDEKQKRLSRQPPEIHAPANQPHLERRSGNDARDEHEDEEEEQGEEEEGDEEQDVDPEVRRREELRARMAKISGGGMGMGGMFGMPMPMVGGPPPGPPRRRKTGQSEDGLGEPSESSPPAHAPPVPAMMALPGMSRPVPESPGGEQEEEEVRSHAPHVPTSQRPEHEESEQDEATSASYDRPTPDLPTPTQGPTSPPPIPGGRPAPPPVPSESRPPPPPPPQTMPPQSEGSESDDELSERPPIDTRRESASHVTRAPPPPPVSVPAPPVPTSPRSPHMKRQSQGGDSSPSVAPSSGKRMSRPPPPIPGSAPLPPPGASRPPPPPPPGALSRSSTADVPVSSPRNPLKPDEEETTEYEGDYDTDIASSVPHKDALKAHARDSSYDDNDTLRSPGSAVAPTMPPPPPVPTVGAPIPVAAPPPIPSQPPPPPARPSAEMPRGAPPPPPPKETSPRYDDEEYDPYNYSAPKQGIHMPGMPQPPTPKMEQPSFTPEPPSIPAFSPPDRRGPPPPAPSSGRSSHRQSLEVHRGPPQGKKSIDANRPSMSMDLGYCANDIDLAQYTNWWQQPNTLPPALQGRKDIYYEFEEQTSTSGAQRVVTRDVYILYQDYSQTTITLSYDANNISDVEMDQKHDGPPRAPRQDELENVYERFGRSIVDAAKEHKEKVVGDGTPQGLIMEILRPIKSCLLPVGTRAYGALVYQNLANASTQLHDEIRPGDIISIRNAKFQGKHGPMHAKYSVEVGKPDHVGIVAEWDGTKKKVRAWEQGRESKKCKVESFKLDDLRSGEVKIWRVMPRSWVNWDDRN